jgi:hypothetical protein
MRSYWLKRSVFSVLNGVMSWEWLNGGIVSGITTRLLVSAHSTSDLTWPRSSGSTLKHFFYHRTIVALASLCCRLTS